MSKKNDITNVSAKQIERTAADIKKRIATVGEHDMFGRYDIGEKVQAFRELNPNEKYAKKMVRKLAAAVGVNAMTLYNHADVARTWTRDDFRERAGRGSTEGITFSHFVVLAGVKDAKARAALLDAAIQKRLSVREVKAQIRPKRPRASKVKEAFADLLSAADSLLERAAEGKAAVPAAAVEDLRSQVQTLISALEERARLLDELHGAVGEEAAQ